MEDKVVRRSPTLVPILSHMNPFNVFPPYFLKVNFYSSLEVCRSNRFMHFSFLTCSHIKETVVTHFKAFECHLSGLIEDRRTRRSDVNTISLESFIRMASHDNITNDHAATETNLLSR